MKAARETGRHGHRDATLILIGYRHALGRNAPPPVFAEAEFRVQELEIDDAGRGKEMPTLMPLTSPALFMWQLKMPMMIAGKNEAAASRQQASSTSQLSH